MSLANTILDRCNDFCDLVQVSNRKIKSKVKSFAKFLKEMGGDNRYSCDDNTVDYCEKYLDEIWDLIVEKIEKDGNEDNLDVDVDEIWDLYSEIKEQMEDHYLPSSSEGGYISNPYLTSDEYYAYADGHAFKSQDGEEKIDIENLDEASC